MAACKLFFICILPPIILIGNFYIPLKEKFSASRNRLGLIRLRSVPPVFVFASFSLSSEGGSTFRRLLCFLHQLVDLCLLGKIARHDRYQRKFIDDFSIWSTIIWKSRKAYFIIRRA